jgi:hypothetical protein
MKKLGSVLFLALMATLPVFAQDGSLDFQVGAQSVTPDFTQQSDGNWTAPNLTLGGLTFSNITLEVDSDPFVHYSYSVSNTSGSDMAYSTTANAPAVLAAGPYTISSSLGVSVTDFSSNGSVSVWPNSGPLQEAEVDGTDVTPADLGTVMITESIFGATNTRNFSAGPVTYSLINPSSQISTVTSFNLSDGADVGITGFFQIAPTPEPSSFVLGLLCLGTFVVLIVRRRRA